MAELAAAAAPETATTTTAAADSNSKPENDNVTTANQIDPSSTPVTPPPNPSPNPNPSGPLPPPPSILAPPPPPSFRPAAAPVPVPSAAPQFTSLPPPPSYQTPAGIPPPGVSAATPSVMSSMPMQPGSAAPMPGLIPQPYAVPGQQPMRPYVMANGYPGIPQPIPQGGMPPPGVPRFPYAPVIRPAYPPRPLGSVGILPSLARPPVGIRGPVIPPIVRPPPLAGVASTEKPHTTVYVGKISSTVENEFVLSLLQLCGPLKSWKRAQDPTSGSFIGYGFCEFESAEGVLRALRLLNKLSIDGQELMLNVSQATKEYLQRYVEKKVESSKKIEQSEPEGAKGEAEKKPDTEKNDGLASAKDSPKPSSDEKQENVSEKVNKDNPDAADFGLVADEDREADKEAVEKLTAMIEERLKNKPVPVTPPEGTGDAAGNSNTERPSMSRDGESDGDVAKDDPEGKNEDEKTAESKPSSEHGKTETGSPDRRRRDRSRDRDREVKREKEREVERKEREREQERAKREKEREYRSREDERRFKIREKDWETREKEREHWRKREREREKERALERKWEIAEEERESDDGYGKKRKYKTSDEERKRRQREKEDDLADRLREEEEIAEAKKRAEEEQMKKEEDALSNPPDIGNEEADHPNENDLGFKDKVVNLTSDLKPSHANYIGEEILSNGNGDESSMLSDTRHNNNLPARKLGFGLLGSGKRTAVPSVFNEEEDEDAHKDKKMRPLVPIDYTTEEQQAVHPSDTPPNNIIAAAEYAKRISTVNPKEEKAEGEKERGRRSHERSRNRDRHEEETNHSREENRKDKLDRERAHKKTPENQKLLDAKQLIDTIPKTKDELFAYEINWAIYDQNSLHERMRPWISKKITEFLGEEEVTLVDYIVSSTQEHVNAGEMFERLQSILDDEAEMFVLKMWRMLIFEIKKVETGLALRSTS